MTKTTFSALFWIVPLTAVLWATQASAAYAPATTPETPTSSANASATTAETPESVFQGGHEHRHDHDHHHHSYREDDKLEAEKHGPHGGQPHNKPAPVLKWSNYPADIQAMKVQLDKLRDEQKDVYGQIREQREKLKSVHRTLTVEQRKAVISKAHPLIEKLKDTSQSIRDKREQKRDAWQKFHNHAEAKQWSDAKADLRAIVDRKREILEDQRNVVKLQKQLAALLPHTAEPKVK